MSGYEKCYLIETAHQNNCSKIVSVTVLITVLIAMRNI